MPSLSTLSITLRSSSVQVVLWKYFWQVVHLIRFALLLNLSLHFPQLRAGSSVSGEVVDGPGFCSTSPAFKSSMDVISGSITPISKNTALENCFALIYCGPIVTCNCALRRLEACSLTSTGSHIAHVATGLLEGSTLTFVVLLLLLFPGPTL